MAIIVSSVGTQSALTVKPQSAMVPEQFWNAATDPALLRVMQRLSRGVPAKCSIIVGPSGSGKSTLANYFGMWSSCEGWKDQPLPCQRCDSCLTVLRSADQWRAKLREVKGTTGHFIGDVDEAIRQLGAYAKPYSIWEMKRDTPRPPTLCVDGIDEVPSGVQSALADLLDRRNWLLVVLLATDLAKVHPRLQSMAAAAIYTLRRPTRDEAIFQLQEQARRLGHQLDRKLADLMAQHGNCEPRTCLGLLEEYILCGADMTAEEWIAFFGGDQPGGLPHPGEEML